MSMIIIVTSNPLHFLKVLYLCIAMKKNDTDVVLPVVILVLLKHASTQLQDCITHTIGLGTSRVDSQLVLKGVLIVDNMIT